jgi:signal transduction histidine kinase/CheY-like chemotaxis protein
MRVFSDIVKRLSIILSLFILCALVLVYLIHTGNVRQFDYSMKVNVSSRQKAISEELSYRLVELQHELPSDTNLIMQVDEIMILFKRWENSQKALHTASENFGLTEVNSKEIQMLLNSVSPAYTEAHKYLQMISTDFKNVTDNHISAALDALKLFVKGMNDVTGRYLIEQQTSMKLYKWFVAAVLAIMVLLVGLAFFLIRVRMLREIDEAESGIKVMRDAIEDAEKVKAEFLANMSHEIRTPLNGVLGMTELLASTRLEEEQRNFVRNIHSSASNLLDLLNNLLDVAKLQSGTLEQHKEAFNLQDCFDQVIDLLKPAAQYKKLELLSDIQSSLPLEIVQDGTRLKQVLLNLANNAIKFTDRGEVLISVEEVNREGEFILLLFKVSDTGIGICKEEQEKIFQSFYQADSSSSKKYGGTGLGLSISKSYIAGMGGKLWVDSEPGKGAVFAFTIVAEVSAAAQQEKIAALNGLKALVVDDNKTNLKILVRQLSAWGIQTTPFNSPELVADMLSNLHKFDFVIMDMQMPEMDGRELTERIRKQYSASQLPIIVLSSLGEHLISDSDGYYNAYLTKPVRQSRLLDTINEVVKTEFPAERNLSGVSGNYDVIAGKSAVSILVAHDSDLSRAVAEKTLALLGHNFDIVANTSELLMKSRTGKFDLILTDVQSERVDGIAAARQLVKHFGLKNMPVIIGVSDDVERDRSVCLQAGMSDVIVKPLKPEAVEGHIHRWFEA